MRKKLALGAIFSLVGFTIVATVLRGALLSEVFTATTAGKTFNIPWVWFWFHIEFCTGELLPTTRESHDATIPYNCLVIQGTDARLIDSSLHRRLPRLLPLTFRPPRAELRRRPARGSSTTAAQQLQPIPKQRPDAAG